MKKTLRFLSAAAFMIAALCPKAFADSIVVWEDEYMSPGLYEAAREFKKETGISVKIIEHRYTYALEKLRLDGPAGTGPDLVLVPNDQVGYGADQGLIDPIELTKEESDIYDPAALEAVTYRGRLYAVPKTFETIALFYNKDLLPKPLDTLDEYFSLSLENVKKGSYGLIASLDDLYYCMPVLAPYGAYVFGKNCDGSYNVKDIGLNNDGVVKAVSYILKFYDRGVLPSSMFGMYGRHAVNDLFANRKAAACITGIWQIKPFTDAGINLGVTPLPILPNGKAMAGFMGVRGYAVSKWSIHKSAAIAFANFLNRREYAVKRFTVTSELPVSRDAINDERISNDEYARAFLNQIMISTPMPSVPEMQEVWVPYSNALSEILRGKLPVKKGLDKGVDAIRRGIMDLYRREHEKGARVLGE